MLGEHFSVVLKDSEATSRSLITECTNWMDLIFKKEVPPPQLQVESN